MKNHKSRHNPTRIYPLPPPNHHTNSSTITNSLPSKSYVHINTVDWEFPTTTKSELNVCFFPETHNASSGKPYCKEGNGIKLIILKKI